LAKKKTTPRAESKSDAIREVLASQPKAPTKEIKAKLASKGVKASDALINKIKYGRKPAARATKSRNGRAASNGVSKADAIRNMFNEMGRDARPRDIIAALKSKGIVVTSAQVSTLRNKLTTGSTGKVVGGTVAYEHLLAAKQLSERLGGVDKARQALESFARLVEA
jgi:uncharacterized protein YneF (UPF0154 family)